MAERLATGFPLVVFGVQCSQVSGVLGFDVDDFIDFYRLLKDFKKFQ